MMWPSDPQSISEIDVAYPESLSDRADSSG